MASLGIDIGCVSLKLALVGDPSDAGAFLDLARSHPHLFLAPGGELPQAADRPVLVTAYRRIKGSPADATRGLLQEVLALVPREQVTGVRVTGSGGRLIGEALQAPASVHPDGPSSPCPRLITSL